MYTIPELLAQLISQMTSHGASVSLQPGLSRNEIERIALKLPYPLTPELIELYECCNGSAATWFPLLFADSGDYTCVECGEGPGEGSVISYDPEMGNSTEFTSVESMLATVIQYWIEGAYVAVDGKVEFAGPPYTKLKEIGRRMNPGADYWE
jgi:hypothetical protein